MDDVTADFHVKIADLQTENTRSVGLYLEDVIVDRRDTAAVEYDPADLPRLCGAVEGGVGIGKIRQGAPQIDHLRAHAGNRKLYAAGLPSIRVRCQYGLP